jgi:hypothetical protein
LYRSSCLEQTTRTSIQKIKKAAVYATSHCIDVLVVRQPKTKISLAELKCGTNPILFSSFIRFAHAISVG